MIREKIKQPVKTSAKQKTAISILMLTIIVFFYFAIMILLNKLEYNAVLVGVFREMLTIPALIALGVCFVLSLAGFIRNRFHINSMPFYALVIQLVTVGLLVYIA